MGCRGSAATPPSIRRPATRSCWTCWRSIPRPRSTWGGRAITASVTSRPAQPALWTSARYSEARGGEPGGGGRSGSRGTGRRAHRLARLQWRRGAGRPARRAGAADHRGGHGGGEPGHRRLGRRLRLGAPGRVAQSRAPAAAAGARLPASLRRGARSHGAGRGGSARPPSLVVVPEYDHRCCWTSLWPAVLADLERRSARRRD